MIRAFIVGCPRSGTTLLQSLLLGHPDVFSCPETFYFIKTINGTGTRHRLRLASKRADRGFETLRALGLADQLPRATRMPRTERFCARWFVEALDRTAGRAGKQAWIEKTPSHLSRLPTIEHLIGDARFIHMIRAGSPNVASLLDVTHQYPDAWGGERSLEACADRWRGAVEISALHAGRPNHAFVSYERLVSHADEVVSSVWQFLGLSADPRARASIHQDRSGRSEWVSREEPWKRGTQTAIMDRNASRLDGVLSADERARLENMIAPAERVRVALPFL